MIPLFKPSVGEDELNSIKKTLDSGWIGFGPRIMEFEEKFAEYIGVLYAIALNSCTAALHLALKSLGVSSGEVIVPSLTFVSTVHAILYNNAKPVFADVYEDTLCIDIEDIQEKITNKTKAIIPVHYSGHPCDMDPVLEIAEDKGIVVIEDAAQACGAEYKGKKIGSLESDATCFSFEAKKNLTCGEGGMITTKNDKVAEKVKRLRWVGIDKDTFSRTKSTSYDWYYEVVDLGYKYHMNDIQAAMGIAQLQKLDSLNEKRKRIVDRYNQSFSSVDWIEIPIEKEYVKSAHWNYVIKVEKRNELISYLKEREISTGVHYMPIHLHPFYRKFKADVPITEKIWKTLVTLPLYPDITESDLDKIINAVENFRQ